ncbi:hypothetical protein N7495_002594 [Penicillium taxi]|uniref:uncharacterized protein n=1 Tax=Penicillium taxi TaxID=168475 RepID=UPI0025454BD2|nr:uncharacterized protein N7495_002594 [Penicillium taxi]KAJ5902066.1 hypothetical protein N7495_002594 [Penicillium taxi]
MSSQHSAFQYEDSLAADAKDVSEVDALDYVAAYTVGNDVSARKLQTKPELAGPMPQACFSKGFDTYAPMGPVLVATSLIPDPTVLKLETRIDGELRQKGDLNDLAFSIPYLIHYLSSGTTLQKGTVIMTGTPGGKLISVLLQNATLIPFQ